MKKSLLVFAIVIGFVLSLQFFSIAQAVDDTLTMHLTFDEGKGGDAEDHSNFQNDGVLEGAEWVTGKIGKAVSFDGGSYVGVMPGAEVGIGLETTWALWFKPDADGQGGYLAALHGTMTITLSAGLIRAQVWANTVWNTIDTNVSAKGGEWYHVAVTWSAESGEGTIYVDGEEVATAPAAGVAGFKGGRQLAIAANDQLSYPGTGFFTGVIDDFRIYNRALSETEVMGLITALAVSYKAKLAVTWGTIKK